MRIKPWTFTVPILSFLIGVGVSITSSQESHRDFASEGAVRTAYKAFVTDLYGATEKVGELALHQAAPYLIKWKVGEYIESLPLDPTIKKRVLSRLTSGEVVDEVIPFLWSLKTQYTPPEEKGLSFDDWARKNNWQLTPGGEHSMFRFNPPAVPNTGGGFKLPDKNTIAKFVALYDLLFVREGRTPLKYDEDPTPEFVRTAIPAVKDLLTTFKGQLGGNADIGGAIGSLLEDPERLEIVTTTLIMAIRHESFKAFQIFAKRIIRQDALKNWMTARLDKKSPKHQELLNYLLFAQDQRRYAIHIVVDGLQGHLVEALSRNQYRSPFIQALVEDNRPPAKPAGRVVKPLEKKINSEFINMFSKTGYRDLNYLPFFRRIYTSRNGVAEIGVSTTPTISVRNLPIVKTGEAVTGPATEIKDGDKVRVGYPGTGIPNFHFVNRKENGGRGRAYYFYGNDALLLERMTARNDMKTMYDRLNGLNTMSCNAQYEHGANSVYNAFLNLAIGEKVRDFGESLCLRDLFRRAANEKKLSSARRELYDLLNPGGLRKIFRPITDQRRIEQLVIEISELEDDSLPQYLQVYNPWPDHFAHGVGPFSDEILSPTGELNRLDFWLRQIEAAYRDGGVLPRVMWGMAGDHGLTPVFYLLNPEVEVFEELKEKGYNLVIEKISSDEGEGPKTNHPTRPKSMRGKDVVIASTAGGNYMMDFFIHDEANWGRQPLFAELTKWRTLQGKQLNILDFVLSKLHDSLDYMIVRETPCNHDGGSVHLIAERNGKRVSARVTRVRDRIFYESADDLLGVREVSRYDAPSAPGVTANLRAKCLEHANRNDQQTWCTEDEWRELTSYTNRQDSVAQISHIYDTDLAGTVNLFPLPGIGYNSKVPGRHAGEHFHEKDAFVGFWGDPVRPSARPRSVVNGSIAPTLYDYLTFDPVIVGKDGWGYPSILTDIKQPAGR